MFTPINGHGTFTLKGFRSKLGIYTYACLFFVASNIANLAYAEPYTRQQTLVIGKVSNNPSKHYKSLKPMVDYAAQQLQSVGIKQGKVLLAKDNEQLIDYLNSGQIDWVTETVYSALAYKAQAQAEFLVRKWKKGVPEYHTVFFARKDSNIKSIAELANKKLALEDEGSTTAYFLPMMAMLAENLNPKQLSSTRDAIDSNATGYAFAEQEINIVTWVHKGIVDAGAYSNLNWNKSDHTPAVFKKDMEIIHRTPDIPRALELVRNSLPAQTKQQLKEILLSAHTTPEGRKALKKYQKTSKFDALTPAVIQRLSDIEKHYIQFQKLATP